LIGTRIAAVFSIIRRTNQIDAQPLKRAWQFLGTGLGLWVLADLLYAVGWAISGSPLGVPSFADLLRLAGYFSLTAMLVLFPARPPERFGQVRRLVDFAILVLSVLALAWMVFIRSVLDIGLLGPIQVFWLTVWPVFDFLFLSLTIRLSLLVAHQAEIKAFRYLIVALLVLSVTDLLNGYVLIEASYRSANLVRSGWMLGNILLLMVSRGIENRPLLERVPGDETSSSRASRIEPLLPIIATYAVVGVTVLDWWSSGTLDWLGVLSAALLSLLLFARQGIIVGQMELRQFVALINASPDMAFICKPDGEVRLTNPALEHAIGLSTKPVQSRYLGDFIEGDSLEAILEEALETGWTDEVVFRHLDGRTFPVALALRSVRDERSASPMLVGTGHDLTAVKQRESDLQSALEEVAAARVELEALNVALEEKVQLRTQELEATVVEMKRLLDDLKVLDRLKTEFVALVSHELRAPLTNIRSGVELILNGSAELQSSARESLSLVQSETDRLAQFVETILDLSSLEAGKFPMQVQPLQLDQVLNDVSKRYLEQGGLDRLDIRPNPDLPLVAADRQAIDSVLFHLIDNALKYAPTGDISIETWSDETKVYIAVNDSGPGVPPEDQERVFELFYRRDMSDAREIYGYGLGLPMVRRLLEAMDGGISIEESASGGARFVFWLCQVSGE
jgi:two-component system phosphate regulon sensor histidine kinase PhoR